MSPSPAARRPAYVLAAALVVALIASLCVLVAPAPAQAANARGVTLTSYDDGDAVGRLFATLTFTKRGIRLAGTSTDVCPGNGWGLRITARTLLRGNRLGAQKFRYNGNGCDAGAVNFGMFVRQAKVRGARIYLEEYKSGVGTRNMVARDYVR